MSWKVSPARVVAFTPKNIKACFAASGLFPFNPERVLRSMPNPAESAIPRADEVKVGSCRQDVEQAGKDLYCSWGKCEKSDYLLGYLELLLYVAIKWLLIPGVERE